MDEQLLDAIRDLVADLASGKFREIEADGRSGRLTAQELESAVQTYGRTLLPLPDEAVALIEVFPDDLDANMCALDVDLWVLEEGRSDLTLSLVATREHGRYQLTINDLHVL